MEEKAGIDNKLIGQRIREERDKLNLTREDFSEIIGLSEYYLGQLERGDRQMSLSTAVKIAHCFHISLDYLVYGKACCDHQNKITYFACDPSIEYDSNNKDNREITALLGKCSPKELHLIKKIIKTILPYL